MKSQTWKEMSSFQIGGAICLPVLMAGYAIARQMGLESAIIALTAGNLILYCLALISVKMSFEKQVTTAENSEHYFGNSGKVMFSAVLALAKLCWFGIQLNMMSTGVLSLLPEGSSSTLVNGLLGALIVGTQLLGMSALSRFATLVLTLFVGTIGMILYSTEGQFHYIPSPINFEGISIAIAVAISRVVDLPTFMRYSRSLKDGVIAVSLLYLLALPSIEGVGVYLAQVQTSETLLQAILEGGGFAWTLWVAFFLALGAWTTNNTNLYSALACSETFLPRTKSLTRTLFLGSLGTGLAMIGILNHFTDVLQLIGIMVGTMGSVILTGYCLKSVAKGQMKINLIAWGLGVVIGLLSLTKIISLSQSPLVDSCLVASLSASVGYYLGRRQYETARS